MDSSRAHEIETCCHYLYRSSSFCLMSYSVSFIDCKPRVGSYFSLVLPDEYGVSFRTSPSHAPRPYACWWVPPYRCNTQWDFNFSAWAIAEGRGSRWQSGDCVCYWRPAEEARKYLDPNSASVARDGLHKEWLISQGWCPRLELMVRRYRMDDAEFIPL